LSVRDVCSIDPGEVLAF